MLVAIDDFILNQSEIESLKKYPYDEKQTMVTFKSGRAEVIELEISLVKKLLCMPKEVA